MASNKINKAEVERRGYLAFQEETEEQIVQELVKFNIYGEANTFDEIIEAAKNNVTDTRARVEELKNSFVNRQNKGEQHLDGRSSLPSEIPVGNVKATMEIEEDFPCNKDASISVNKFLQTLFDELDENGCEDIENEENSSDTTLGEGTGRLKETSIVVCGQEEPNKKEGKTALGFYGEETPKPMNHPNAETLSFAMVEDKTGQDSENADVLSTLESNQQNDPLPGVQAGEIVSNSNTNNFPAMLVNGEARANAEAPLTCSNETRILHVSETSADKPPILGCSNTDNITATLSNGESSTTVRDPHSFLNQTPNEETSVSANIDANNKPAEAGEEVVVEAMVSASQIHIEERTVEDVLDQFKDERCMTDVLEKDVARKESSSDGIDIQRIPSCSERQSTKGVHLSESEANSTQVSSVTGSPPECELPRSGCVNIEGAMSSEHLRHLPPTIPPSLPINEESEDSIVVKNTPDNHEVVEDGEYIVSPHTSPKQEHKANDDKIAASDSSLPFRTEDEHEKNKCKTTKKSNKKKKANKKDKILKDETGAKRTKSKKIHQRLFSLFCCCFKNKEMNDENDETKESRNKRSGYHVEDTSKTSFVTVDLNA